MTPAPTPAIAGRYSDPEAGPTPGPDAKDVLEQAELYWLTTVRRDGRPHVTPLIGVWADGAVHFCTGVGEQKARNLEHNRHVAVTTGNNSWAAGLDVVVEGAAIRVADDDALQRLADAYEAKYGDAWRWDVSDGMLTGQPPRPPPSESSRRRSWPSPRIRTPRRGTGWARRRRPTSGRPRLPAARPPHRDRTATPSSP
jgi:hypothetical protein